MYPTLPFGPLSLPTGPILILVGVLLGLELAGRYGRRLGLTTDDVWNTGLLALLGGLVVARLWNIVPFWKIYLAEPTLLLSLRPSGFVLLPGLIAALITGYLYLLRRALDPVRVAAALTVGAVAAGIILSGGAYLTGSLVGTRTAGPWALPYFGELRHPVAIYQAIGLWLLFALLWIASRRDQPGRTVLLAALGYSLIRLITDAFVDEAAHIAGFRLSQIGALIAALGVCWLLARTPQPPSQSAPVAEEASTPP
jgi:phosphatidylglycerol:prolipoprotein diacylglycerol transferase